MGEVYRARDPRLGRDVAIKVSAEQFSDRFEREARAIAALNHPHICTLHDVGPDYLVMELVDGPTLADRLAAGPLPLDESLRIAMQIARALQAAHDRGIVHRDLKPANIKITPDGAVKVLDFGLAKQADATMAYDPDRSPTIHPATRAGEIVGTAAYMSPEQARGQTVDKRADIWAFGVVLYEMVTGVRPFHGATVSDTLAAVLTSEPPWDRVPARIRPLVRRCLVKDPRHRLRDIADFDLALEAADGAAVTSEASLAPRASRRWLPWSVAALLLAALAPIAFVHLREQPRAAPPMRFQIPPTVALATAGNVALSPDGRHLAFQAVGADGVVRIWIRSLESLEVRPLAGSETAANAPPFFWSPDSRFVAFDAGGKLQKVNVAGGPAQPLCDLPATALGGSWNADGDIVIGSTRGGLLRVSEAGGRTAPVTAIDAARMEHAHLLPTFLPDGRHFVYLRVSRTAPESSGVYVGSIDAKPEAQSDARLLPYVNGLTYAPSTDGGFGRLLYVREGTLLAQPFDERRLALAGEAVPVAEQVGVYLDGAFVSASHTGVLVYRTSDPPFPITWFDRHGNMVGRVSEPGQYTSVALSPDGTRAIATRTHPRDRATADLWLFDLARGGSPVRFTFGDNGRADFPVWSPDGQHVAFKFGGPGNVGIYRRRVGDGPDVQQVMRPAMRGVITPNSWSPDGRYLVYTDTDAQSGWDLWLLQTDRSKTDGATVPLARSRFNEEQARFSPDGRWIAYVSNETGANEIYVRRFAETAAGAASGSVLVSKGGGTSPRWRRDGKELFYLAPDDRMMAVAVATGSTFQAGAPAPLFPTPPGTIVGDVTADGQRFLLVQSAATPFTVVLNW
jgi:Tol biopolymer transport system component